VENNLYKLLNHIAPSLLDILPLAESVLVRRPRLAAASDKAYQLLAHGRWFSPGTLASSTTKTGRHDKGKILLKVALNIKNLNKSCMYDNIHPRTHAVLVIGLMSC
jgi:hypothetical protein